MVIGYQDTKDLKFTSYCGFNLLIAQAAAMSWKSSKATCVKRSTLESNLVIKIKLVKKLNDFKTFLKIFHICQRISFLLVSTVVINKLLMAQL